MKVTVSFDTVRVVVPCGDGQMLVKELIERAVARYCKAVGKSAEASDPWLTVHNVKSADGGILDPDDRLADVVDDREQLSILYEVHDCHTHRQNDGGDGTSASSGGTASPDVYQSHGAFSAALLKAAERKGICVADGHIAVPEMNNEMKPCINLLNKSSVNVASNHSSFSAKTPSLSQLRLSPLRTPNPDSEVDEDSVDGPYIEARLTGRARGNGEEQRVPTVIVAIDDDPGNDPDDEHDDTSSIDSRQRAAFYAFARDPARKSLTNSVAMLRWLDAQELVQDRYEAEADMEDKNGAEDDRRKEPIGSSDEAEIHEVNHSLRTETITESSLKPPATCLETDAGSSLLVFENPRGPLGIHVVPGLDYTGNSSQGLMIHSIQPDSLVARDGRLHSGDRIIEVNGQTLVGINFPRAQEVFRTALGYPTIKLRVIFSQNAQRLIDTQPCDSPKPDARKNPASEQHSRQPSDSTQHTRPTPSSSVGSSIRSESSKVAPNAPSKSSTSTLSKGSKFAPITSTRLIGKVMKIELVKGVQGLGFSITTRDNTAGADSLIYIKNILPHGAAVTDGRLLPGDRLLQVNDVEMAGKTHDDVVTLLRGFKVNDVVTLTISRHATDDENMEPDVDRPVTAEPPETVDYPSLDRRSQKSDHSSDENHNVVSSSAAAAAAAVVSGEIEEELLELCIAVGDVDVEASSSLLGVSIKGHKNGDEEMGLFIKAIIAGGAAARDGRLSPNDRLIKLNGVPLVGRTNAESMSLLRQALRRRGSAPGYVDLVVSRRIVRDPDPIRPSLIQQGVAPRRGPPPPRPPKNVLRNMSYQIANGESFIANQTNVFDCTSTATPTKSLTSRDAPTINGGHGDTVLIETEAGYQPTAPLTRQLSSIASIAGDSVSDVRCCSHPPSTNDRPSSLADMHHDVTVDSCDINLLELDPLKVFSREAVGRQSMSEKRKCYMDPRLNAMYEQVKTVRGFGESKMKKCMSVESLRPTSELLTYNEGHLKVNGHGSSLQRCASLESVNMTSHDDLTTAGQPIRRGRACNESFRAAVDRSYSRQNTNNADAESDNRCRAEQSPVSSDKKNTKKPKGLLKSFGGVFRLGKARNNAEKQSSSSSSLRSSTSDMVPAARDPSCDRLMERLLDVADVQPRGNHGNRRLQASSSAWCLDPATVTPQCTQTRGNGPYQQTGMHRTTSQCPDSQDLLTRSGRMTHAKSEFSLTCYNAIDTRSPSQYRRDCSEDQLHVAAGYHPKNTAYQNAETAACQPNVTYHPRRERYPNGSTDTGPIHTNIEPTANIDTCNQGRSTSAGPRRAGVSSLTVPQMALQDVSNMHGNGNLTQQQKPTMRQFYRSGVGNLTDGVPAYAGVSYAAESCEHAPCHSDYNGDVYDGSSAAGSLSRRNGNSHLAATGYHLTGTGRITGYTISSPSRV